MVKDNSVPQKHTFRQTFEIALNLHLVLQGYEEVHSCTCLPIVHAIDQLVSPWEPVLKELHINYDPSEIV